LRRLRQGGGFVSGHNARVEGDDFKRFEIRIRPTVADFGKRALKFLERQNIFGVFVEANSVQPVRGADAVVDEDKHSADVAVGIKFALKFLPRTQETDQARLRAHISFGVDVASYRNLFTRRPIAMIFVVNVAAQLAVDCGRGGGYAIDFFKEPFRGDSAVGRS